MYYHYVKLTYFCTVNSTVLTHSENVHSFSEYNMCKDKTDNEGRHTSCWPAYDRQSPEASCTPAAPSTAVLPGVTRPAMTQDPSQSACSCHWRMMSPNLNTIHHSSSICYCFHAGITVLVYLCLPWPVTSADISGLLPVPQILTTSKLSA